MKIASMISLSSASARGLECVPLCELAAGAVALGEVRDELRLVTAVVRESWSGRARARGVEGFECAEVECSSLGFGEPPKLSVRTAVVQDICGSDSDQADENPERPADRCSMSTRLASSGWRRVRRGRHWVTEQSNS